MKKDVIYVDIEDDITSIIEKVKHSSSKIVALVPPKRVTVLQSIVNLKLLQRAAHNADKRVVLITSDKPLAHLAGGLQIPVAKNLQSKPEVPVVASPDNEADDIIDGEGLSQMPSAETLATIDIEEGDEQPAATTTPKVAPMKRSKDTQVPNFDRFRKRLFVGVGAIVLLVGMGYWAFWVAPRSEISITAKTTSYAIKEPVVLKVGAKVDVSAATLPVVVQRVQKTNSIDFDATGKKDVGEKAKGQITIANCETSYSQTILAGTAVSSGGLNYLLDANVSVPGATFTNGGLTCQPGVSTAGTATAQNIGDDYNIAANTKLAVAGVSSKITATAATPFAGGTKTTVTVVSQEDVDKAKAQAASQGAGDVKAELAKALGADVSTIADSYAAEAKDPTVKPAVGEETKRFSVTVETSYRLAGVAHADLKTFFDNQLTEQGRETTNQKIYDSGVKTAVFTEFVAKDDTTFAATVTTKGFVGPKIEDSVVAKQAQGKRSGEIQQQLEAIDGVDAVSVKFSPAWVTSAPGVDKITVKYLVKNATN